MPLSDEHRADEAISAFNRMISEGASKIMDEMTARGDLAGFMVKIEDDGPAFVPLTVRDIYQR